MKAVLMMVVVATALVSNATASTTVQLASCELQLRGGCYNMTVDVNRVSSYRADGKETAITAVVTETSEEGQTSELGSYPVKMTQNGSTDGPVVYTSEDGAFSLQIETRVRAGDGFRGQLDATVDHGRKIAQLNLVCRLPDQN